MSLEPACNVLREDIYVLRIPIGLETSSNKYLYPKSKLKNLLTVPRIREVLGCSCTRCKTRNSYNGLDISETSEEIVESALVLFALLVFIKCPQFIHSFLQLERGDKYFEDLSLKLSSNELYSQYWPTYHSQQPTKSHRLADELCERRHSFFIPSITDDPYTAYDKSTILPFVNEKRLCVKDDEGKTIDHGQGGFGQVFTFEILEEYNKLSNARGVRLFARKELTRGLRKHFDQERENLELVRKLEDPHLIRIIKAYEYGETLNLIFPCAKTNLDQYIRYSRYGAPSDHSNRPELSPLWDQLLHISKALDRIINYCPKVAKGRDTCQQDTRRLEHRYGYHFDLKPANILVESSGKLIITDFGQATFKDMSGSSKVTGRGGTPAYAPPEADGNDFKSNRKYDIWSLGCIFLEVCAFITHGFVGVQDFDEVKSARDPSSRVRDDRFFRVKPRTNMSYEVKPDIINWIRSLPKASNYRQHSRRFLEEINHLIEGMLCVNVDDRLSSETVCEILQGILERYRPVKLGTYMKCRSALLPNLGKSYWRETSVQAFEDSSRFISMELKYGIVTEQRSLGNRQKLSIRPEYLYSTRDNASEAEYRLYFDCHSDEPLHQKLTQISLSDSIRATELQSILQGQDIRQTINLMGVVVQRRAPVKSKWSKLNHKSSIKLDLGSDPVVQLWAEESFKDPVSWVRCHRRNSPRPLSEFLLYGALPRRIVIYHEESILIIRLAKNARIEKIDTNRPPMTIRIIPTDKSRDSTFTAYALESGSLPLDRAALSDQEQKGKFECESISLRFRDSNDAMVFFKTYRILKEEWRQQEKKIDELRNEMGPTFGYAPD